MIQPSLHLKLGYYFSILISQSRELLFERFRDILTFTSRGFQNMVVKVISTLRSEIPTSDYLRIHDWFAQCDDLTSDDRQSSKTYRNLQQICREKYDAD